jgi:hypothetical protein
METIKFNNYINLGFTQEQGEQIEKIEQETRRQMQEMKLMQNKTNSYSPSNTEAKALIKTLDRWGIATLRKFKASGFCTNCIYCKTANTKSMYISLHKANNNVKLVVKILCQEHKEKSDELAKKLQIDYDKIILGMESNFASIFFNKSPYKILKTEGNILFFTYNNTRLKAVIEDKDIEIDGDIATLKKAEIRKEYLKDLFDKNFDMYLQDDFSKLIFENVEDKGFFKHNIVMNIDTGAGKTCNAAKLVLYTLNHTKNRILFSTTKKENLDDFKQELAKWISIANDAQIKSKVIDKWIRKKNKSFSVLGINELTLGANLKDEDIIKNRGIITHHYYAFPKLNGFKYDRKMESIIEMFKKPDIILIDEVDELEKIALDNIPFVTYSYKKKVKYSKNAGADEAIKKTNLKHMALLQCSSAREYDKNPDEYRYLLPEQNKNGEFYTVDSLYNADGWELTENGSINIQEAFLENAKVKYLPEADDMSRKKFIFVKDCKFLFVRVSTTSELIYDRNSLNTEEAIGGYLNNATKAILGDQVLDVYLKPCNKEVKEAKKEIKIDDCQFVRRFEERSDFVEWARHELKISEYDSLIKQLCREGTELYKPYIQARRKNIFKKFRCKKYLFTASPGNLAKLGYEIDSSLKNIGTQDIERIDVFAVEKHRQIDNLITNLVLKTKDYTHINTIAFLALKANLDRLIDGHEKITDTADYNFLDLVTTETNNGDATNSRRRPIHCGRDDNNYFVDVRSILTYLNGVDTTGKNYKDKNLCIINARGELNIKSRRIFGIDGIETEPIETACVRFLTQGTGRIQRYHQDEKVKTKYKAIIIFYDNMETVNKFMETKKNSHIKFNLINIKQKVTDKQVLGYIQDNILRYNEGREDIVPDENFLKDLRENNKNKDKIIYNKEEIRTLYEELEVEYLRDNPKKKRLSIREASKILNLNRFAIQRALKEG